MQPFAATLVSLAALGADSTRFVIQLPDGGNEVLHAHHQDSLHSASRLHLDADGAHRVVQVDALKAISEAKVQCAISPGTTCLLPHGRCNRRSDCMHVRSGGMKLCNTASHQRCRAVRLLQEYLLPQC